jgi:hypothetical protein
MGSEAAEKKTGGSGLTVAQVASYHEFGLGVPRRSFIRDYVDQNAEQIRQRLRKVAKDVGEGRLTLQVSMARFGEFVKDGIQSRIEAGIDPELSEATVKQRGPGVPLDNTGQLKSSIDYEVERGR